MAWAEYAGLSIPSCVRCCGVATCAIECVSSAFVGSPVLPEVHSVVSSIGLEWDVTMSVTGDTMTTSGTITEPTAPGEGTIAAFIVVLGSPVYLATKTTTGSSPWDMAGTESVSYTYEQIYSIIIGNIAPGGTPPDGGYLVQTVSTISETWGVSASPTAGTECAASFNDDGGGVYSVTWVNARLRLDNLEIGVTYVASMDVYENGVFLETIETTFTATETTEYTPYTDLLQEYSTAANGNVYEVSGCTIEVFDDPCAEYLACYEAELSGGTGYDDGYADGYGVGYGTGFLCDPYDNPDPVSTYNCPPDTSCEDGTAAGYQDAYNNGYFDGYVDGYDQGFIDGGC